MLVLKMHHGQYFTYGAVHSEISCPVGGFPCQEGVFYLGGFVICRGGRFLCQQVDGGGGIWWLAVINQG